jgi:hypothetical protein
LDAAEIQSVGLCRFRPSVELFVAAAHLQNTTTQKVTAPQLGRIKGYFVGVMLAAREGFEGKINPLAQRATELSPAATRKSVGSCALAASVLYSVGAIERDRALNDCYRLRVADAERYRELFEPALPMHGFRHAHAERYTRESTMLTSFAQHNLNVRDGLPGRGFIIKLPTEPIDIAVASASPVVRLSRFFSELEGEPAAIVDGLWPTLEDLCRQPIPDESIRIALRRTLGR